MARKPKVSDEAFIAKWNECSSTKQVAEALEMQLPATLARAMRLRGNNIELKQFTRTANQGEKDTQFATIWNNTNSPKEAAEKLEITVQSAQTVACRLRKRGVELKRYKTVSTADDTTFIQTWNDAKSPADVAEKLGMRLGATHARAFRLRKENVALKHFARTGKLLDDDAFETTWNAAENGIEAAKALGVSQGTAYARARKLREAGKTLKNFKASTGAFSGNAELARKAGEKGLITRRAHAAERAEEFLKIWNDAESQQAAAEKLGVSLASLRSRASMLRTAGYACKKYPRGRKPKVVVAAEIVTPEAPTPNAEPAPEPASVDVAAE